MAANGDAEAHPLRPQQPDDPRLLGALLVLAGSSAAAVGRGLTAGFWQDEGATASAATRALGDTMRLIDHTEAAVGGYVLLMSFWSRVAGSSELAMRAPSLLAGAVTVVVGGLLAARMANRTAGVVAGACLALHPTLLPYFGIEARAYAVAAALVAVAALAGHRTATTGSGALLWAVSATLAIAAHAHATFAIVPQVLWIVAAHRNRTAGGRALAVAGTVALPAVSAVVIGLRTARQRYLYSWIPEADGRTVLDSARSIAGSGTALVLAAAVLAIAVAGVIPRSRGEVGDGDAREGTEARSAGPVDVVVLVGWALGPLVVLVALSGLIAPTFLTRYLLPSTTAFAVLAGLAVSAAFAAIGRHPPRTAIPLLAGSVLAVGVTAAVHVDLRAGALRPEPKGDDLRSAAAWVVEAQQPGDVILYDPGWAEMGMRWYLVERGPGDAPSDLVADRFVTPAAAASNWTPPVDRATAASRLAAAPHVWIAGYPDDGPQVFAEIQGALADAVRRCWQPVEQRSFGLVVELWARPSSTPAERPCA